MPALETVLVLQGLDPLLGGSGDSLHIGPERRDVRRKGVQLGIHTIGLGIREAVVAATRLNLQAGRSDLALLQGVSLDLELHLGLLPSLLLRLRQRDHLTRLGGGTVEATGARGAIVVVVQRSLESRNVLNGPLDRIIHSGTPTVGVGAAEPTIVDRLTVLARGVLWLLLLVVLVGLFALAGLLRTTVVVGVVRVHFRLLGIGVGTLGTTGATGVILLGLLALVGSFVGIALASFGDPVVVLVGQLRGVAVVTVAPPDQVGSDVEPDLVTFASELAGGDTRRVVGVTVLPEVGPLDGVSVRRLDRGVKPADGAEDLFAIYHAVVTVALVVESLANVGDDLVAAAVVAEVAGDASAITGVLRRRRRPGDHRVADPAFDAVVANANHETSCGRIFASLPVASRVGLRQGSRRIPHQARRGGQRDESHRNGDDQSGAQGDARTLGRKHDCSLLPAP